MDGKKPNIYIATLPRSGSTLLGMILGNHLEICHIGESSYWGKVSHVEARCSCGKVGCDFLRSVEERVKQYPEIFSIHTVCAMIDRLQEPDKVYHKLSLPNIQDKENSIDLNQLEDHIQLSCLGLERLADIFREFTCKRVIVDNTKNIWIAEYLIERKGWKIILLIRDPRGMAYSNKQAGIRKNVLRPLQMKIPIYIDFAERALRLLIKEDVLFVRYENLCANPEGEIKKICDFLNVTFESKMLYFKSDKGHTLMGNRMRFDDNEKIQEDLGWQFGLSDEERNFIYSNASLVQLFALLGYNLHE